MSALDLERKAKRNKQIDSNSSSQQPNCPDSIAQTISYPMDRPTARRLPDEMVFRILSFLPEKPLGRFRCVCKLWNTLFIDPKFRALYCENYSSLLLMSYNQLMQIRHNFCSKAESSDGLILEQTVPSVSPSRCRIRCPLSLQSIEFPGPQKPSLCFAIEFLPSIRAVELVSVHEDENQVLGYEVLHIGPIENITPTTKYSWRALQVPNNNSNNQFRKRMRSMSLHYRLNRYLDSE
ncbi:PREDICTED: uncharacterized protein LOC109215568 isoform X2 [Nicotiana attenuata]|uniref:uncharacterized protein LOC109215568 isoform X2 n=1 Tax=Nicotiana attenuata TaxID=49451 RepID=UPI0009057DDE|nr:PREDICTED: uncharacterized protein LOC109215568 isoform X2 [Nicotiana attenuata]